MNTGNNLQVNEPVTLPDYLRDMPSGEWMPIPDNDPAGGHIAASLWDLDAGAPGWEAARFSKAVYLYRAVESNWKVIVKYYEPKTGQKAAKYAARELDCILEAKSIGLGEGGLRAIQPLAAWRGVLFLEYVEGLTLGDAIAVRQSRPGELLSGVQQVSGLMARLHSTGLAQVVENHPVRALDETIEYIDELERWGVLEQEPDIAASLRHAAQGWEDILSIAAGTTTWIHGDATTTNFILPPGGGAVAIDWERMGRGDPAFDIGRLSAEVSHSIREHGGRGTEVVYLIDHIFKAYIKERPEVNETGDFLARVRFYRASSLLRIARNGWVSRLDRMGLVAEAMSLLVR